MSKKRKSTKRTDSSLLVSATLGTFFFGWLNFVCWIENPLPKETAVTPVAEDVAKPVAFIPRSGPNPKLSKSEKIVAFARLAEGDPDNWGETLDQAYRRGWRP